TTAGVGPARVAAGGRVEVIAGVEITAEFRGAELHLLGYFINPEDEALGVTLAELRAARRERLIEMARRFRSLGLSVEGDIIALPETTALGRRHLARVLIARGHARSLHDAFTRVLATPELAGIRKQRLPVAEAIALVRGAGGVASWAHPPADVD